MSVMPSNIVRQGAPSRTAHVVAAMRAAHQLLDEPPILPDPYALRLLGAQQEAALRADPYALNDPISRGVRAAVVARSRYVEDELARCVEAGVRQYVVLGAGLDTYACRSPWPEARLRVFEVDHAGTQGWKQQLLAEAGIPVPAALRFVPLDFEHGGLDSALAQAGFRAHEPACVGWMGVTMYLTAEAVLRVLNSLADLAPGSCVCFDYRVPAAMLDPIERVVEDFVGRKAAAAGEPWLSAFDPARLQRQMLDAGYASARSAAPDELNARYFARRKDGLRTGGGLRIMCARIAGGDADADPGAAALPPLA